MFLCLRRRRRTSFTAALHSSSKSGLTKPMVSPTGLSLQLLIVRFPVVLGIEPLFAVSAWDKSFACKLSSMFWTSLLLSVAFQFLRICCTAAGVLMSSTVLVGKWSEECSTLSALSHWVNLLTRLDEINVRSITDDWSFRVQVGLPSSVVISKLHSLVIPRSCSASRSVLVPTPPHAG